MKDFAMYGYDDSEIRRLSELIDEIRRIRYRTCEPKNNSNPRYHALSTSP
jgi:hypothetical protein